MFGFQYEKDSRDPFHRDHRTICGYGDFIDPDEFNETPFDIIKAFNEFQIEFDELKRQVRKLEETKNLPFNESFMKVWDNDEDDWWSED